MLTCESVKGFVEGGERGVALLRIREQVAVADPLGCRDTRERSSNFPQPRCRSLAVPGKTPPENLSTSGHKHSTPFVV